MAVRDAESAPTERLSSEAGQPTCDGEKSSESRSKWLRTSDDLSEEVECPRREGEITEAMCLDGFRDAHAKAQRDDPCWQCEAGAVVRLRLGFDLSPTARRIEAMLNISRGRGSCLRACDYRALGVSG